jgi:erythromycin esterase
VQDSWEDILHHTEMQNGYLFLNDFLDKKVLDQAIGHRAIGVVYHPDSERFGNYVPSVLPARYDAFVFFERTKALHALHIQPDGNQMPETYPFGV